MKANSALRGPALDDRGVSDVLGAILLVGITVVMMVGLSAVVLNLDGPRDRVHMDVRISVLPGTSGWGTGDEAMRIEHIGGEGLATANARIVLDVDGDRTELSGAALGQGFSDGVFAIGDSWERVQTIAPGAEVEVLLIDDAGNAITTSTKLTAAGTGASTGGGSGATSGIVTYVTDATVAAGTVTDLAAAQNGSDAGAAATFQESSSGGAPGGSMPSPAGVTDSSGITGGATGAQRVLASDDDRATLSSVGSYVEAGGFAVSGGSGTITGVIIGFEAQRGSGTGSHSVIELSYAIDGTAGPVRSHAVSGNSDTHYTSDVTGDRSPWTFTQLQGLRVTLERESGDRATQVDHIYVTVTYTTPLVTDLEATLAWAGVPSAAEHELQVRYLSVAERFTLQVATNGTWNSRGTLESPSSASVFRYILSEQEYAEGAPQVRIIDADFASVAGEIQIDYARIDSR